MNTDHTTATAPHDINEQQEQQTAEQPVAEQQEQANEQAEAIDPTEKLNAEIAEWKDKYLRLYSEFENFRRRTQREKADLVFTAGEGVITKMLPVLDDFERAEKAIEGSSDIAALKEGVALVRNKFRSTLEGLGLKPMNAAGTVFNPDLHEAITQIPAPTPEQKNTVLDEVEKGYILHEKPIRFAKVVIGS